jgi:hypothetical protein
MGGALRTQIHLAEFIEQFIHRREKQLPLRAKVLVEAAHRKAGLLCDLLDGSTPSKPFLPNNARPAALTRARFSELLFCSGSGGRFSPASRSAVRILSLLSLDSDVHRTGAQDGDQEPRKPSGTIDQLELGVFLRLQIELDRLPYPGVIDAKPVRSRLDLTRRRLAVQQSRNLLIVQLHNQLALLYVGR